MDIKSLFMGLGFALIWSSAYTSAKIIVQDAPPMTILSLRFLISGALVLAIAYVRGQRFRPREIPWRAVIIFGLCQNTIYLGLMFVALQYLEAGLVSIIASALPLVVALIAFGVFRERVAPFGLLGLALGFGGVIMIMAQRLTQGADIFSMAICVLAVVALAVAALVVRGASMGGGLLVVVGLQMLVGSVTLAIPAALFEQWVINWSLTMIAAFSYTILVPGVLATIIWFNLVNRIGATKAATFHFLNPFFGVAAGWAILGEPLGLPDIIGVAVIMIAILMVQVSRVRVG